jgi:hypothetical protein
MADEIRLTELVAAMARRGTPLASETGLFIALEATERARAQRVRASVHTVCVTDDGDVTIEGGVAGAREADGVAAMAGLLRAVVNPQPPGVRAVLARIASGQLPTLLALRNELHASLVPLNRAAARRVLGRQVRESLRAAAAVAELRKAPAALDTLLEAARPASPDERHHATRAGSALDTAVDAPRPARSALDTEPDGLARAMALHPHAIGSASPDGSSWDADDGEAAPTPLRTRRSRGPHAANEASTNAVHAAQRGDARRARHADNGYDADDAGDAGEIDAASEAHAGDDTERLADDEAIERILRRRRRASGGARTTLWLVALLVLAAGGFLVYRLAGPHTLGALPASVSPASPTPR